jgi:hypothetical protein
MHNYKTELARWILEKQYSFKKKIKGGDKLIVYLGLLYVYIIKKFLIKGG